MSYCVNCGVELDATAAACPLCNTKVYNPNQPVATEVPTPYPTVKGAVEPVKAKEFTILMTIILLTTAVVCVLLNVFYDSDRSLVTLCGGNMRYVVGVFYPTVFP